MRLHLFFFLVLLGSFYTADAQRDYYFRDSTSYPVNNNTTIIASKRTLYRLTNNTNIEKLFDFTIPSDTTYYIRDVDFLNDQKGYVLIGKYYIGSETNLYVTENGGITFRLDTTYHSASMHKSINQMQLLDSSTFVLFDGYYESSVLRSFDGGKTWANWFNSLIAHYFQLHKCSSGKYYLIGLPGDGFSSYSFEIPDSLWSLNNIPMFMSGCHNGAKECVRVWREGNSDRKTDFIAKQIDTLNKVCGNITVIQEVLEYPLNNLYPNPSNQFITILHKINNRFLLYNAQGIKVFEGEIKSNHYLLDLAHLSTGMYYLEIGNSLQKIIKQ